MDRTTPDRLNGRIMLLLVLVGAALAFVGWYRFFARLIREPAGS